MPVVKGIYRIKRVRRLKNSVSEQIIGKVTVKKIIKQDIRTLKSCTHNITNLIKQHGNNIEEGMEDTYLAEYSLGKSMIYDESFETNNAVDFVVGQKNVIMNQTIRYPSQRGNLFD